MGAGRWEGVRVSECVNKKVGGVQESCDTPPVLGLQRLTDGTIAPGTSPAPPCPSHFPQPLPSFFSSSSTPTPLTLSLSLSVYLSSRLRPCTAERRQKVQLEPTKDEFVCLGGLLLLFSPGWCLSAWSEKTSDRLRTKYCHKICGA